MKKTNSKILLFALAILLLAAAKFVLAASNIVTSPTSSRYAWNDVVGWIDFYNNNDGAEVLSSVIRNYATSSVGEWSLDCATSPDGNICGTSDYKVINDGSGNLTGWAWNDSIGWVSFCGGDSTTNCPGTVAYQVLIDPNNGDFSGWAWNDTVGWVSFNCADPNVCATSSYKVDTAWISTSTIGTLDSSVFDTGVSGGAQINSVVWQGSMPSPVNGSSVSFQFAVSDSSSGPWNYKGPDGTDQTYYSTTAVNTPAMVNYTLHNDMRYFRYRITLTSNQTQTFSPRVDNVSVNWSY